MDSSGEYLVKYNVNSKSLKKSKIEVTSSRGGSNEPAKHTDNKEAAKEDVLDTMERKETPKKPEPR